jgi:hypothetical protein
MIVLGELTRTVLAQTPENCTPHRLRLPIRAVRLTSTSCKEIRQKTDQSLYLS